jgi:hypothetical protein
MQTTAPKWIVRPTFVHGRPFVVVLLLALSSCGGQPVDPVGVGPTAPGGGSTTSSNVSLPGSVAPNEPEGMPHMIVGTTGMPGASYSGTDLVLLDRRSGRMATLLSAAELAALVPGRSPSGASPMFVRADLSSDGRFVAATVDAYRDGEAYQPVVVASTEGPPAPRVIDAASVGGVRAVRFSPNGRWVAGIGTTLTFWPVVADSPVTTKISMPYPSVYLAWSPDGTQVTWANWSTTNRSGPTSFTSSVAQLTDPASPASLTVTNDQMPGTTPWWSADGQLHAANAVPGAGQLGEATALDTDSSFTWVLGERRDASGTGMTYHWWPAVESASGARPLTGLPDGFRPRSW